MADPAPDPAPGLAPQKGTAGITPEAIAGQDIAAMRKAAADEHTAVAGYLKQAAASRDETTGKLRSIEDIIANLKHPELEKPPELQTPTQTNPVQAWSSAAMMLAAIGSLFTRRPLATAMKSAAAALNAFHDGDQERLNAAFAKWKVDMDNYWKVANYQQEIYKDTLGALGEREKIIAEIGSEEQQTALAEINAIGAAFKDDIMVHAHSLDTVMRIMEERDNKMQYMAVHQADLIKTMDYNTEFAAWNKAHPNATDEERAEASAQILSNVGHQWTDQQRDAAVEHADKAAAASVEGKNYEGAKSHLQQVLAINPKQMNQKTVIDQAQALDQFIQTINGNRAIRGFQLNLIQKDAGLLNRFEHGLQQIAGGGAVTPEMVEEMQTLARDYTHIASRQYGRYITEKQWAHWKHGLDPTEFVPSGYDPGQDDPLHENFPSPTQEDIDTLKASPSKDNWLYFDTHYGQGAAAGVLAEGMTNADD